jgi:DNA-binding NtrC family response regulator
VDDNRDLLRFLQKWMGEAGCLVHLAGTPAEARDALHGETFSAIFVDSILTDANGVELAVELHHKLPSAVMVIMTDDDLSAEEQEVATSLNFALLRKPFLSSVALAILNDRMQGTSAPPRK